VNAITIPASWHGHPRFYELWKLMGEIHSRKNNDYAGDADPLRNFRKCEGWELEAWKGALVRLEDKLSRIESFAMKPKFEVKDESFVDTCIDGANYFLLMAILFEEQKSDETNP